MLSNLFKIPASVCTFPKYFFPKFTAFQISAASRNGRKLTFLGKCTLLGSFHSIQYDGFILLSIVGKMQIKA